MNNQAITAIVMGSSATALYAIRELGENGVIVYAECNSKSFVKHSKYIFDHVSVSSDEEQRLENLIRISKVSCDEGNKPALIPCSDQDVEFVSKHSNKLKPYFFIQDSILSEIAVNIMDKGKLFELCKKTGIEMPACWVLTRKQLCDFSMPIDFPCILKPTLIHNVKSEMKGRKLWVLNSKDELLNLTSKLPIGSTDWILQELIPGPESEIVLYASYIDQNGNACQSFTGRKLRQFPPGFGSASLVSSKTVPELEGVCNELFSHAGYKGIVAAEFKRDSRTNTYKMIEVNARPSLWFSLTTAAGKKITYAAVQDLVNKISIKENEQNESTLWRYYLKDLYSKVFYKLKRNFVLPTPVVVQKGKKLKIKSTFAVYRADDFKPVAYEIMYLIQKLVKRLKEK